MQPVLYGMAKLLVSTQSTRCLRNGAAVFRAERRRGRPKEIEEEMVRRNLVGEVEEFGAAAVVLLCTVVFFGLWPIRT